MQNFHTERVEKMEEMKSVTCAIQFNWKMCSEMSLTFHTRET